MALHGPYKSLDRARREIRLLSVDIDRQQHHQLIQPVPLNSDYIALSYPWGGAPTSLVWVSGCDVAVSPNLMKALKAVVAFYKRTYPNRQELLLWTDQLCINQSDDDEKSWQVEMMGGIYRQAHQTLVWLPDVEGVSRGFNEWSAWRDWHRAQILDSNRLLIKPPMKNPETGPEQPDPSLEWQFGTDNNALFHNSIVAWRHIHAIVRSPWWSRGWIYQEFTLTAKITFLFDGLSCLWEKMRDLLALYYNQRDAHVATVTKQLKFLKGIRPDESWTSKLWVRRSSASRVGNVDTRQRDFLTTHGKDIIEADLAWQQSNYLFQSKTHFVNQQQYLPLSNLLKHARNCQLSNPKDRIYAFLSLADPSIGIEVDYSTRTSPNDVLVKAAKAMIGHETRLDIVSIAMENTNPYNHYNEDPSDVLPSWVPDWSTPDYRETKYKKFLRAARIPVTGYTFDSGTHNKEMFRVTGDLPPMVTFLPHHGQADRMLRAGGIYIDVLKDEYTSSDNQLFRNFRGTSNLYFTTTAEARLGDEIWALIGADEPYALRWDGRGHCRIMGHVYIRDVDPVTVAQWRQSYILHGQLIDELQRGKRDVTFVDII